MRTNMRYPRTARITAGAIAIAAPASAVALTAGQADALSVLQLRPAAEHLRYGHKLTVSGYAPRSDGGYRLALEFAAPGRPWRTVAHTKVHSNGVFRLRAPLTQSGTVRVVPVSPPRPARTPILSSATGPAGAGSAAANLLTAPVTPAPIAPSVPQRVAVAAKLSMGQGALDVLAGQPMQVHGTLLPRRAGAIVRLQTRARGRWRTIALARTRRGGRFVLRHVVHTTKQQTVRVRFTGDVLNTAASTPGRTLVSLHPALASWYYDAGSTACGFHAGNGVASPYLPCGTKVTFAYHGRSVTAVVDDRGPFVGGRQFDLNQATAGALGFNGVDTVWSSL